MKQYLRNKRYRTEKRGKISSYTVFFFLLFITHLLCNTRCVYGICNVAYLISSGLTLKLIFILTDDISLSSRCIPRKKATKKILMKIWCKWCSNIGTQ